MTNNMKHDTRLLPISQIKIGDRHRKDLGDLCDLAASIEKGLLQPIGVSPEMELIWGLRRLVATQDVLGRDEILCRIVSVDSIVQGEFDENMLRKDFTPSERVAIVEALRGYAHGGDRKSDQGRNCDLDRLTTKDAAGRVGFCRDDYFRAKKVVSQGIPELVEAMDSGKLSISAASELAGSHPDTQRRVLATVKDENGWAVRGMRKSLNRAKRRMAIELAEGRTGRAPRRRRHKDLPLPLSAARRGRWDQAEFGQPCADRHSLRTRILAPSRRACGVRRQGSGRGWAARHIHRAVLAAQGNRILRAASQLSLV